MDLLDCTVPVRATASTGTVHYGNCGSVAGAKSHPADMTLRELRNHPKRCGNLPCDSYDALLHNWAAAERDCTLETDAIVLLRAHMRMSVKWWHPAEQMARWVVDVHPRDKISLMPTSGSVLRMSPTAATWLWKMQRPSAAFGSYHHLDRHGADTLPYLVGDADTLPGPDSSAWATLIALTGDDGYRGRPDVAAQAALALHAA